MKLGFVSDSLAHLPLPEMLDHAVRMGVGGVEITTGGWSAAPHVDLQALRDSAAARRAFRTEFEARGLQLLALNAIGNPLHPNNRDHADCLVDTLRAAGELGVPRVCSASGLPGGGPNDLTPNWIVTSWPPETRDILHYQWEECLIPFWNGIAMVARDAGVDQIALELRDNQCVYNVATLMTLREEIGPLIGAALNPAQQVWMGADPMAVAGALGEAIYHVHAKDTMLNPAVQAVSSLLETGSLMDVGARSWSHVTIGIGHGADWWQRFCYHLRVAGYDGWLSIDHRDVVLGAVEGLEKSVQLLRGVLPVDPPEEAAQAY
ncbi:sugar phosphate isomerase/epimerase family protein [Tropicibacter alexandrii]|uniref:sugar phosphate isomerase/epimerase family protein n=1 Tax=Tropicibacter alexandrii TaxID=2267683 RepID=UPI000EF492EE|nr:sugar phosphate isomerase/epimerase [Tropicibacter alexandrii]